MAAPYVSEGFNFPEDLPDVYWPPGVRLDFLVPIIVANSFSYILTGALISQCSYYLRRYRKDALTTRAIVWCLLLFNLAHTGLQISRDVCVLGRGFGDWRWLGNFKAREQDVVLPVLSILIIGSCQIILAARSYLFCRSLAMGSRLSWAERGGVFAKAALITGSVACGIGSVIAMCTYPNLFKLGLDNRRSLFGQKAYPMFEMMWLLLGTLADIWIAWSMWADAKRAKTGYGTSSDSILQVLINVALRCGASLAIVQTGLQILYFAHALTWADAAHSVLPRLASLSVIYSLASPKEAYRAQQRREGRHRDGLPTASSSEAGSHGPSSRTTSRARHSHPAQRMSEKKPRKGIVFFRRNQPPSIREDIPELIRREEEDMGGNWEKDGQVLAENGTDHVNDVSWTSASTDMGRLVVPTSPTSVVIQTTSVVSVQVVTADEEADVRLGNSVIIQGPPRPRSMSRRDLSHPFRSPRSPAHRPLPSPTSEPPNFIDSFPSRATNTTSTGVYDPDATNEYDLPPIEL